MHVMVATDGNVDADKAAAIVGRLAGDSGQVTVYSMVEVPRGLLDDMRAAARGASDVSSPQPDVEYRTTQADDPAPTGWIGDDAVIRRYVNAKVSDRTAALVAALESAGIANEVVGEEGEKVAKSVIEAVNARDVDVLCIGTHGLGRFEGLLGSESTKICRLAPCSVVLVR